MGGRGRCEKEQSECTPRDRNQTTLKKRALSQYPAGLAFSREPSGSSWEAGENIHSRSSLEDHRESPNGRVCVLPRPRTVDG